MKSERDDKFPPHFILVLIHAMYTILQILYQNKLSML